mmetsp:Transcript_9258/g.16833  ORF Transcript_9258/g.16833 Transcript_9258/m.16833 type:complete len:301 (-) Transcript_9258:850-1752(-)
MEERTKRHIDSPFTARNAHKSSVEYFFVFYNINHCNFLRDRFFCSHRYSFAPRFDGFCRLLVLVPQFLEHFKHVFNFHFAFDFVFSGANIHRSVIHLSLSYHKLEVVLCHLSIPDLLLESILGDINVGIKSCVMQFLSHSISIIVKSVMNGNYHGLSRTDPEWPFAAPMFTQDRKHTFHTTQHSSVYHNRTGKLFSFFLAVSGVLQIKTDGKLKVKLDGSTLMDTIHGIHDLDINFWSVKGTIARIHPPISLADKSVHGFGQRCLRTLPQLDITQCFLWSSRQFQFVRHSKDVVNVFHKV